MPDEFDLIAQYFAPLAGKEGLGLVDDAACLKARPGYDLIVSKDLLVGGTHFFDDVDPVELAGKALAVNVSDLAAKGAKPAAYFLGLALPHSLEEGWVKSFSVGLQLAQRQYELELLGGDTTSTEGPVCVSVTVLGYVAENTMIKRSGAQVGDDIYVTGTLGDAALGLRVLQGKLAHSNYLVARYHRPVARWQVGPRLIGLASAAADVSDGLLADLGHICRASSVGAAVLKEKLPLSPSTQVLLKSAPELEKLVWSGGDDYEIVFTAPQSCHAEIDMLSSELAIPITKIGKVEKEEGVRLVDQAGDLVQIDKVGFQHFRQQ